jgi:hypothetical protein
LNYFQPLKVIYALGAHLLVETFRLMRRNPAWFYMFLAGLLLPMVLDDFFHSPSEQRGGQAFITFYLLMAVQKMILTNGSRTSINGKGLWSYSWRHFAILAVVTVIALVPLFTLGKHRGVLGMAMIILCVAYPFFLALVGTWPMAPIVENRFSLGRAVRCGLKRFFRTFARLFVAFVAPFVVVITASAWIAPPDLVVNGKFSTLGAITDLIGQGAQLVSLTYIGVVLTRKYLDNAELASSGHAENVAFVA